MADFLKVTKKPLGVTGDLSIVGVGGVNAAKSGSGSDTSAWGKATSTVGAMSDGAAKSGSGSDLSAWGKATSTVGTCGDNAAKSGTGA